MGRWTLFIYLITSVLLSLFTYLILLRAHRSFPARISYTPKGIHWITLSGKEIFVPWEDVIKVNPIGDYGRILSMEMDVFPTICYFSKTISEIYPVSAEVAEKIREYIDKYKNQDSKNLKIEGGDR